MGRSNIPRVTNINNIYSLISLRTISVKGTNTFDFPIFNQLTEEEIKLYFQQEIQNK
jgi:hypothetical protein